MKNRPNSRNKQLNVITTFFMVIQLCLGQIQEVRFTLEEESGPQTIGTLDFPQGSTYRLSTPNSFFELNENTGELRTTQSIDREGLETSTIALLAVAATGSAPPIEILIEVTDINDNSPIFPDPKPVTLEILESIEVGTQYFLPTATDEDSEENGVSTKYEIADGDVDKFSLLVDSSPGDQTLLYLKTEQQFNREDVDHYELNISATDDGIPPRQGFLSVQIEILDSNDNAPLFDFSQYTITIPENTTVGTVVLNVRATDPDKGDNGLVRYRIGPQVVEDELFTIDPITGNLSLVKSLDYETSTTHRLTLEAYDSGVPVLFGRAFVVITVENVNDNKPSINFRFVPLSASIASVNEDDVRGTTIAFITVTDDDSSRVSETDISLYVQDGNSLNHFELVKIFNVDSWRLNVIGTIDRLVVPQYNLIICAEDSHLTVIRTSCSSLEVVVNTPNDHAPVFLHDRYNATVSEIAPMGSLVAQVSALDIDIGITGRLKYRISEGNVLDWFTIGTFTGVITSTQTLEYDTLSNSLLQLVVIAQDESLNPLSRNTSVFITITAANDNVPRFEFQRYQASVDINSLPADVMTVTATDDDVDLGANIQYSITSVHPLSKCNSLVLPHFTVSETGVIRLHSLPFAASSPTISYEIVVMAKDDVLPCLSSSTVIQVDLISDSNPALSFYPNLYYANLSPGFYSNLKIAMVRASFRDQSRNSVHYSLITGDSSFSIDAVSGRLFVSNRNFHSSGLFVIQVGASSNGVSAVAPATVYVFVTESVTVFFEQPRYYLKILESAEASSFLTSIIATSSVSANLTYQINDGDVGRQFHINSVTGALSLNSERTVDFEVNEFYNLTVVVTLHDAAGTLLNFATCKVFITLVDVNDNAPVFSQGRELNQTDSMIKFEDEIVFRLTGDQSYIGRTVYNASAFDCDSELNGQISYSIEDPLDALRIDENGIIVVKRPFPSLSYNYVDDVTVTSCDHGSPQFCNSLRLHILIKAWLGKRIATSNAIYSIEVHIPESSVAGSVILDLSSYLASNFAYPTTVGPNGDIFTLVSYVIVDDISGDLFGVFPDGQVHLKRAELDRESTPYYNLVVNITVYNQEFSFSINSTLTVFVDDINDNRPQFSSNVINFTVFETEPIHTLVGYIQANDFDSGIHSSLVYTLSEDKKNVSVARPLPFAVNKYTGAITTTCELDLERLEEIWADLLLTPDTFQLRVIAKDNSGVESQSTLSNQITLQIHVQDRNEFPPEFTRSLYFANVTEDAETSAQTMQLTASDRDKTSTLHYSIESAQFDLPFAIDSQTGVVSVTNILDRETQSEYSFSVTAMDGVTSDSFTSSATVQVKILDVNDNRPTFDESSLILNISEGTSLHQIVGQLKVNDLDERGPNSAIRFVSSSENSLAIRQTFRVDEPSGQIILINTLDREAEDSYDLIVEASDSGTAHQLTSTATVRVNIGDINDNAPQFLPPLSFSVEEGSYPSPIFIGRLNASDDDIGNNSLITFKRIKQTPYLQGVLITLSGDGRLYLYGDLDREKLGFDSKIQLLVQISDNPMNKNHRLLNEEIIEISVGDVNDNDPILTSPDTILISTNEIHQLGRVASLTIYDPDNGVNGSVSFVEGLANPNQWFRLQSATGVIELYDNSIPADRSNVFSVSFGLQDSGIPSRVTLSSVRVIIGDLLFQNSPSFETSTYSGSVAENAPSGTNILTVSASGLQVNYFITEIKRTGSNEALVRQRPFEIDETLGNISNLQALDAENISSYTVTVVAVDMGSTVANPRVSSTQVTIVVNGLNDNEPEFQNTLVERRVVENEEPYFTVATLSATDADAATTLAYSLVQSPGYEKFRVNTTTGIVSTAAQLDAEEDSRYILTIIASDGTFQAHSVLVIIVDDVNDNNPEFVDSYFVFAIKEGSSAPPSSGRYIGSVAAVDPDIGFGSITSYEFVNGSDQGLFKLDSQTALLSLNPSYAGIFDREERDLYVFIVRATDGGGRSSEALVYVNIEDVNDNAPLFTNTSVAVEVPENVDVGFTITTVHAEDVDLGFNGVVQYRIIGGDPDNQFFIALDSGVITTKKELDRETKSEYELIVMAMDLAEPKSRLVSYLTITVLVLDVNDNSPLLIIPESLFVTENVSSGNIVLQVGALDPDATSFSPPQYSLLSQQPASPSFTIDSSSGEITLESPGLDRETTENYTLIIAVNDGVFQTTGLLNVQVCDINDNYPVFDPSSRNVEIFVNEDAKTGLEIATMHATDLDHGYNGLVKYRFSEKTVSRNFAVDALTGAVYILGSLDHELETQYNLVVEAYDCGVPSTVTSTNVTITVNDVNNNAPVISPSSAVVHVNENLDSTQTLLQLKLSDDDSGNNGRVDFRIASVTNIMKDGASLSVSQSSVSNFFRVLNDGQFISTQALDREEVDSYTVVITAVDRGIPTLTASSTVLVVIDDVNEYAPTFQPSFYQSSVYENASVGEIIFTLTATDNDAGTFGQVRYGLSTENVPFLVNPSTGDVIVAKSLDRESQEIYDLVVTASDSDGMMALTPSASVTITILDINDNSPEFQQSSYSFNTNSEADRILGVVFAIDADRGRNGEVLYEIVGSDSFRIDSQSGAISSAETLISSNYQFQVFAKDSGEQQLMDVVNVTVSVNDFDFPNFASQATPITIMENIPPNNDTLFTFQAIHSSSVMYFLVGGNIGGSFWLNEISGELTRIKTLDRETTPSFELWIEARSSGMEETTAYTSLIIEVSDENDNPPVFSQPSYTVHVREDEANVILTTVSATDADSGAASLFEFSISENESENPERFILDQESGDLRNRIVLNREEKDRYILTILATDQGTPSWSGRATVEVIVDDVNDNGPQFTRLHSATIRENAMVGEFVVLVTSTDLDLSANSQNRYSLTDDGNGSFAIDPLSGMVTVRRPLDREQQARYTLQVTASDEFWLAHTSITVDITDFNDEIPTFERESYYVDVNTGLAGGSSLLILNITDLDEGRNQKVYFQMITVTDLFSINHTTGEIFSTRDFLCSSDPGALVPDCPSTYFLAIRVRDCGAPNSLASVAMVTVRVHAINEHSPVFVNIQDFPVAVLQSASIDTPVIPLLSADGDRDALRYSITGGNGQNYFSINEISGEVFVSQSLTSNPPGTQLELFIRVEDDGFPRRQTQKTLTIEITSENIFRPNFGQASYIVNGIPEDLSIGSSIITITSTDLDSGVNGKVLYSLDDSNNHLPFSINQTTGKVYTVGNLDYETTPQYIIEIIAQDCGMLPLRSNVSLTIDVADVNDNKPLFNDSYFVVYVEENIAPQSKITRLVAFDMDFGENAVVEYGVFPQDTFIARSATGDIFTALSTQLNFESRSSYQVTVVAFNNVEESLNRFNDSAVLKIIVTDQNEFIPTVPSIEHNLVSSQLSLPGEEITRIQASDRDGGEAGRIRYVMAGWSEGQGFAINQTNGALYVDQNARFNLGDVLNVTIFVENPGFSFPNNTLRINFGISVITEECIQNPCVNGATCQDGEPTFVCLCQPGFTGRLCEQNIDECQPNPCSNNGVCTDLDIGFSCLCDVGFTGETCDNDIDFCVQNPCQNNGTCVDGISSYDCFCTFGTTGTNCEINSLGFQPLSFLSLPSLDLTENSIFFEFATVSPSALLLYNHAGDNLNDFVALEIIEGRVRLSYRLEDINNRTNRFSVGENLSDGLWHRIRLSINNFQAEIAVDECTEFEFDSSECSFVETYSTNTNNPFSRLSTSPLILGGVRNYTEILNHPGQVSTYDFVGCIRSLRLNSATINSISNPAILQSFEVTNGCTRIQSGIDGNACFASDNSSICGAGATCSDIWSTVLCDCPDDKSGNRCQNERVGSTFDGDTFLSFVFSPEYIREQILLDSGVLSLSTSVARRKRTTSVQDSSISIRFRTRQTEGSLLHVQGTEPRVFASLQIQNGTLIYTYSSVNNEIEHVLVPIDDGQWHDVDVELQAESSPGRLLLTLDGDRLVETTLNGDIMNFVDVQTVEAIFVGGGANSRNAFSGCIFSFHVNGQSQPLGDDGESAIFQVNQINDGAAAGNTLGVIRGCTGSDVCASNPCPIGFYCNDIWKEYECVSLSQCNNTSCLNGATCIPSVDGSFSCLCAANYTGPLCAIFIPCLGIDCNPQGPNRECVASSIGPICSCREGFEENDERQCVASLASPPAVDWWIYVVVVVGVVLLIIFLACIARYCWKIRRESPAKETATNGDVHSEVKKTPTPKANGHSNEYLKQLSGDNESRSANASPRITQQPEQVFANSTDYSENNAAANHHADEVSSSGIRSVESSSPIKEKSSVNHTSSLPEADQRIASEAFKKPSSPLPSYELALQHKYGVVVTEDTLQQPHTHDVYQHVEASSTSPSIPSNFFHHFSDSNHSESTSSHHPPSTRSNSFKEKRMTLTDSQLPEELPRRFAESHQSSNSSILEQNSIPYLPNGRVSPTKSPATFPLNPLANSLQNNYGKKRNYGGRKSRKFQGSNGSSSCSSSSYDHPTPQSNPKSIEQMVKHLNGIVGLTPKEIELLSENPLSSQGYASSSSESSCGVPSFPPRNIRRPPLNRPSSLPGQRIHQVPVRARSRTPMFISSGLGVPTKHQAGVRPNPHSSPDFRPLPPPEIISDDELVLHQNFDTSSSADDQDNFHYNHSSKNSSYARNKLYNPDDKIHLDFLMSYGKHYEGLAGVFEDLAALPVIEDEEEPQFESLPTSGFASTSFVLSNHMSASEKSLNTASRSRILPLHNLSSASPGSGHSSKHSSASKRQEHYV